MAYRGPRKFGNNREKRRMEDDSEHLNSTNPTIQNFLKYRKELDDKHDRYERLVKLSRDITIESKRIIFLLHNIDARKNNKESILQEAKERLDKLIVNNFSGIAHELINHEVFQYIRAISPAIQEFIEAWTFHEYLSEKNCSDWEDLQQQLKYKDKDDDAKEVTLHLPPAEFMLGLADNTGEIMRFCINSLGSGETDNCFKACKYLQNIYAHFLSINSVPNHGRDFSQKITTMKASTLKAEHVGYQLVVRGKEGAKFPSLDFKDVHEDNDEGFY